MRPPALRVRGWVRACWCPRCPRVTSRGVRTRVRGGEEQRVVRSGPAPRRPLSPGSWLPRASCPLPAACSCHGCAGAVAQGPGAQGPPAGCADAAVARGLGVRPAGLRGRRGPGPLPVGGWVAVVGGRGSGVGTRRWEEAEKWEKWRMRAHGAHVCGGAAGGTQCAHRPAGRRRGREHTGLVCLWGRLGQGWGRGGGGGLAGAVGRDSVSGGTD